MLSVFQRRMSIWAVMAFVALPATAQDCLDMLPTNLVNSSTQCESISGTERAFGGQVIAWKDNHYLFENTGNEIKVWDLDTRSAPEFVARSSFGVPNAGDSDNDLLNFSVCADCRWGIANYKGGTVLFDLGDESKPGFAYEAFTFYSGANAVPGAFTFSTDDQQVLIASSLPDECFTGDSTIYRFDGTASTDLDRIGCVVADPVPSTQIVGGHHVGEYLYLGNKTTHVFLMRIVQGAYSVGLEYVSWPMIANMVTDTGLAIDENAGVAVEANSDGMHVWDISDPGSPVFMSEAPGDFNRAAVSCQYAWVAKKGYPFTEQTFDIRDPTNPQPLDQSFWSPEHYWNYPSSECVEVEGAVFSPDQSILYLARYGLLQMVDMSACGACYIPQPVFSDDFESATTANWSTTSP